MHLVFLRSLCLPTKRISFISLNKRSIAVPGVNAGFYLCLTVKTVTRFCKKTDGSRMCEGTGREAQSHSILQYFYWLPQRVEDVKEKIHCSVKFQEVSKLDAAPITRQ